MAAPWVFLAKALDNRNEKRYNKKEYMFHYPINLCVYEEGNYYDEN